MRHNLPVQAMRLATIALAIVVFAAGCSQSEDEISDESESATSTYRSSSATVDSSLPDIENATASTSLATRGTATTQVSVQVESPGSSEAITETATTTTALLPPVDAEDALSSEGNALSGRVAELVDFAVDACGDLEDLLCARALWDACMQVRIELGGILILPIDISTSEIVEIDDLRDDICSLFQMVQYWELYSILSAKYGEDFYRPDTGFFLFRGAPLRANRWNLRIFPRFCDDECRWEYDGTFKGFRDITRFAMYLPDDSRVGLLRFTFEMRKIFSNMYPSAVLMSEDEADRILGVYEGLEIDDECYAPLLTDIFPRTNVERGIVSDCIIEQCDNGHEKFFLGCYRCSEKYREFFLDCNPNQMSPGALHEDSIAIPDDGDVFQYISGIYYSKRLMFWEVLKYACTTGEIHTGVYADDACRTVAHNICIIIRDEENNYNRSFGRLSADDSFSALESAICDLTRARKIII